MNGPYELTCMGNFEDVASETKLKFTTVLYPRVKSMYFKFEPDSNTIV